MTRRFIATTFAMAALAGCGLIPQPPKDGNRYFVLAPAECQSSATKNETTGVVSDVAASADPAIDSQRIMYAKSEIERGFYQFAFWVDSPVNQIPAMARARFICAGLITDDGTASPKASRLELRIEELYHDARSEPGVARVIISAVLTAPGDGHIARSKTFSREIPAESYSAEGAVKALNAAVNGAIDDMTSWLSPS